MFGKSEINKYMKEIYWIEVTRTSCYMKNSKEGMRNMKTIELLIVFGTGQKLKSTYIGDK